MGTLVIAVLFGVGAALSLPRVEQTLARAIEERLAEENIDVEVRMSGQDATLFCVVPLPALNIAVRYAAKVEGVRSVDLDPSCTTGGIPVGDVMTSTTIEVDGTVPQESTTTSTTEPAPTDPVVQLVLSMGRMSLLGSVASDDQRSLLVEAAGAAVGEEQVDDRLVVDATSALTDADAAGLAELAAVMPGSLVSGRIGWDGVGFSAAVVVADEAFGELFEVNVDDTSATLTALDVQLRSTASVEDAAETERLLNALVAAEPILFDKGSVTVSGSSQGTVRRAAAIAEQFAGLRIEVQGHTDSEGDAGRNLTLSEQRAAATLDALVSLGVPPGDVVSKGYGETQLIRDANGRELPEKSRRVVFVVTLA